MALHPLCVSVRLFVCLYVCVFVCLCVVQVIFDPQSPGGTIDRASSITPGTSSDEASTLDGAIAGETYSKPTKLSWTELQYVNVV